MHAILLKLQVTYLGIVLYTLITTFWSAPKIIYKQTTNIFFLDLMKIIRSKILQKNKIL